MQHFFRFIVYIRNVAVANDFGFNRSVPVNPQYCSDAHKNKMYLVLYYSHSVN